MRVFLSAALAVSSVSAQGEWRELFNGKDLSGWTVTLDKGKPGDHGKPGDNKPFGDNGKPSGDNGKPSGNDHPNLGGNNDQKPNFGGKGDRKPNTDNNKPQIMDQGHKGGSKGNDQGCKPGQNDGKDCRQDH